MPKGYLFGEIEITDAAGYDEYRKRVPDVIAAYGGRYLVRGGDARPLDGDMPQRRFVILEFDSPERASEFYHSAAYQAILPLRLGASRGFLCCLTGVPS